MHIPGHVLHPEIAVATAAASAALIAWAAGRADFARERLARLGAAALAVLALQAVDLPILGGTSAHLLGGTVLAILFGPWLASLGIAAVFAVQAFLLGEGGADALGANVLNGGLCGSLLGFGIYRSLAGEDPAAFLRRSAAGFLGAAGSFLLGASLCAAELAGSGQGSLGPTLGAMGLGSYSWSALEGALTVFALNLFWALETRRIGREAILY